jgi:hypothetical protein
MRVITEQPIETYFELRMLRIPADTELKGSLAAHLYHCGAPVKVIDPAGINDPVAPVQESATEPVQDDVLDITGTVEEVLTWVGDEPGRAAEAHEAESGKDKPRSTLLKRLEEIAN